MTGTETFDIPLAAAEVYEAAFVPALFAEWAPRVVDLAGVRRGHTVLDVACGTGVVARTAADRLGGDGAVVGVDVNEAMLTVARRLRPDITWRRSDAHALPFDDACFDVVLCQMGLMFFADRARALTEMARVLTRGGALGVVVPASLEAQPAYAPFVRAVEDRAGQDAASLLETYWSCGDLHELLRAVEQPGLDVVDAWTHLGTASFPSVEALVRTEVEGSPLASRLGGSGYGALVADTQQVLAPFTGGDGSLAAPFRCHVVVARKPPGR